MRWVTKTLHPFTPPSAPLSNCRTHNGPTDNERPTPGLVVTERSLWTYQEDEIKRGMEHSFRVKAHHFKKILSESQIANVLRLG